MLLLMYNIYAAVDACTQSKILIYIMCELLMLKVSQERGFLEVVVVAVFFIVPKFCVIL